MRLTCTIWLCIALLGGTAVARAAEDRPPRPPILSGCEYDYAPFCIVREDGRADGFAVELLRSALAAMGREVTFETGPWPQLKQSLAEGRLQALPLVARTAEREETFDFTFPYLTMHGTIVVRQDNADIRGPGDLQGKRVAVLREDVAHEYLRGSDLGAVIVPLDSFATAMRELSEGKHDAVVIQKLLALQLMQQLGLENLRTVGPPLRGYRQVFCFAVREGDDELLSVLNEGLAIVMADGTFRRLHAKWFSALEAAGRTRSRIVVGGDSDYPPYEFLDENGQPAGYNVDLTRAIARRMGMSVDIRLAPWATVREGLRNGEIDAVHGMVYSAAHDEHFDFSQPHALVQHAIVVRQGSPVPANMGALAGKSVLLMQGDIMHDLALQHGYQEQVVAVESQEEALRRLAAGEGDCALVARLPALHWIEKHGWGEKLLVSTRPVLAAEYCYAVPAGKQALLGEFAEGLAAVRRTGEYRAIRAKWLAPYEDTSVGLGTILKYGLYGAVPVMVLLVGALVWTRSLQAQVRRHTSELEELNETLEHRVAQRTGEVRRQADKLRALASQLSRTEQRERKRLATVLHDHIQQLIVGARMQLEWLKRAAEPEQVQAGVLGVDGILHEALEASRNLTVDLSPPVLRETGLVGGLNWLATRMREKNQLTVNLRADTKAEPADEETRFLLFECVRELLFNAAKHAGVSEAEVAVGRTRDGRVRLIVSDAGKGFDPELLRVRKAGEATFGLFSIQERLAHVGGKMVLETAPLKGTRITLTAPLGEPPPEEAPEPAPGKAQAPTIEMRRRENLLRVLIVDDHKIMREGLTGLLQFEPDIEVVGDAADGFQAVEFARSLAADVVIMDVNLPNLHGVEATRRILAENPRIKVIALSMHVDGDLAAAMRQAGATAYLTKGGPSEDLIAAIRTCRSR